MKRTTCGIIAALLLVSAPTALSHPGSGIVVDRHGNIYFVDTGSGVWKIDTKGTLTRHQGPAFHWMAIDRDGALKNVTLPRFARGDATVSRAGTDPSLLLSSDFPVTGCSDGSLSYPWLRADGRLEVYRLSPSGTTSVVTALSPIFGDRPKRWLNGIAGSADGSIYFTTDRSVGRIKPDGEVVIVADGIALPACEPIPGVEPELRPYLRGLDVDGRGNVYVAASGCGAVLKISPDGKVTTVVQTKSPWSPTGVALSGDNVIVLEYTHTASDNRTEWIPRVRRIAPDGRITLLASIERR